MSGLAAGLREAHLDRHAEALVQGASASSTEHLADAVDEAGELAVRATLAHIGSQAGTCEVQGVHDQQGAGTSQTTCTAHQGDDQWIDEF